MPFAEFQPGNAGLALPQYQFQTGLQTMEAGMSMMDRAQRRKFAEQEMNMKREQHAAAMVTSDLQQKSMTAEIALNDIKLKDAERTTSEMASLREQYKTVAPQLAASLDVIAKTANPREQRRLFNQLQSQASTFYRDPNLRAVLDKQFAAVGETITANESFNLADAVSNGRTAPSRQEALALFPGEKIEYAVDPGSGVPVYVASGKPDPTMERKALNLLTIAASSGDPEKINELLKNPLVDAMMGVPGSTVPRMFYESMQSAAALQLKRATATRAVRDQDMQEDKFEREQDALTASGYSGRAKTEQEASKFRTTQSEFGSVLNGIGEVRRLGKEYLNKSWAENPIEKTRLRSLAAQQVGMIVGALRLPITGPGVMTAEERKFIEELSGNPTRIFSLSKTEFALLDSMERKFNENLDLQARTIGYSGRAKPQTAPVTGSRAQALARGVSGAP
jgi:hypothetical protein